MTPTDLKAWRARMGYTQREAAEAMGLSQSLYSKLEWGGKPIIKRHILIARLRDRETRLVKALEPLLQSAKNSRQIATSEMGRRYIRAAEAALADSE